MLLIIIIMIIIIMIIWLLQQHCKGECMCAFRASSTLCECGRQSHLVGRQVGGRVPFLGRVLFLEQASVVRTQVLNKKYPSQSQT